MTAISRATPTSLDIEKTAELKAALMSFGIFESDEENQHRKEVLEKLRELVRKWIWEESVRKNMAANVAETGGNIYTFGSYRLGVHHRGAGIEALCVAHRHIHRCDFFLSFYEILKQQPGVKDLRAVEDAFVPVIKMNFDGIEIDLLFARLNIDVIPDSLDLQNDLLLENLDQKCVRSLNGCRVTDGILRLVPNIDNFTLTLQTIKLWAKRRGIYSSKLGYLGGMSLAILVARICQLYPKAAPATLVHMFFLVFSQWMWPIPVLLKHPTDLNLGLPVWNPWTRPGDRHHLLPVLTPAHPHQNAAAHVTASTRTVIAEEFRLGLATTDDIMQGECGWERLFEVTDFFARYKHFIVLLASSATPDHQRIWGGLIESRIRHLITTLENNDHIMIAHVHPQRYNSVFLNANNGQNPLTLPPGVAIPEVDHPPSPFEENSKENGEVVPKHCSMWFIGLVFESTAIDVDITDDVSSFNRAMYCEAEKINVMREGMVVQARHVRRKQLRRYLSPSLLESERPSANKRKNEPSAKPCKKTKISTNCMVCMDSFPRQPECNQEKPQGLRISEKSVRCILKSVLTVDQLLLFSALNGGIP